MREKQKLTDKNFVRCHHYASYDRDISLTDKLIKSINYESFYADQDRFCLIRYSSESVDG